MRRVGTGIVLLVCGAVVLYAVAAQFYRGSWRSNVEFSQNSNGLSNYPVKIEHGLPFPCRSHNQIMACLNNVVVTIDILGFHLVATLPSVMLPVASIVGSKRLGYVQGLLTLQATSDDVNGSITLNYDQPGADGQLGASAELEADGGVSSESTNPGNGSYSIAVADKTYAGKFTLDSYNATLNNLGRFCAAPLLVQETSQVEFTVPSIMIAGAESQITLKSKVGLPIAVKNCTALANGLAQPLLANPWRTILAAFEKSDAPITVGLGGDNTDDWVQVSVTVNATNDYNPDNPDVRLDNETFNIELWQSTVNPDSQYVINGTALVGTFQEAEIHTTLRILGIEKFFEGIIAPDEIVNLGLEKYHNQATFIGCNFSLGPYKFDAVYNVNFCGQQPL